MSIPEKGWVVHRIAADGTRMWERIVNGVKEKSDRAYAVAHQPGSDRIFVTGYVGGTDLVGTRRFFMARVKHDGSVQWGRSFGEGEGKDIVVDRNGVAYATGTLASQKEDLYASNLTTVRMNQDGARETVDRIPFISEGPEPRDKGVAIDSGPEGNIYVFGIRGAPIEGSSVRTLSMVTVLRYTRKPVRLPESVKAKHEDLTQPGKQLPKKSSSPIRHRTSTPISYAPKKKR